MQVDDFVNCRGAQAPPALLWYRRLNRLKEAGAFCFEIVAKRRCRRTARSGVYRYGRGFTGEPYADDLHAAS